MSSGSYEFSGIENEIIDKCGRRARVWGIFSIVIGALSLIGGVVFLAAGGALASAAGGKLGGVVGLLIGGAAVLLIVNGIVYGVMGKLYMDAGESLRAVITTEGSDIEHILQSLKKLGTVFQVEAIMTLVAFVIGLAAGYLGVAANAAGG